MHPKILHRWIDNTEVKRCGHCHRWLLLTSFPLRANMWDKLRASCRECSNQATEKWRLTHPGKNSALSCAWAKRHPDKAIAHKRTWAKKNHDKTRACSTRHRARKHQAAGYDYTTTALVQARINFYGGLCYLCGKPAEAIDHVKPLARGGSHWPANLRPICTRCNVVKGAKWPYELVKHRGDNG